jgi:hypothetical protein
VKLSPDDLAETIDVARDYLRGIVSDAAVRSWESPREFARALVQIADACVVGVPCERHEGVVHGQEAEELRAGVEQILRNTADVSDDAAAFVLAELRRSLIFLLDHIDARDSLAFREATDPSDVATAFVASVE